MNATRAIPAAIALLLCVSAATAESPRKPRARDLGIPFDGTPGAHNAITDVAGVRVGYTTLVSGGGAHAVRTGVTAILPRGRASIDKPVFGGVSSFNGNGEMTGTHWIHESGFLEGPVLITNTHSVGLVRDAAIAWRVRQGKADASGYFWSLPVVAETWDGELNDVNGFHVKREHVFRALERAQDGAIAEGAVGGGTGMTCHGFKCGTGTSSRVVRVGGDAYAVGVLVQANYGVREELRIAGVPVGRHMPLAPPAPAGRDQGSIIVVIATDAPLLPTQLQRLARRAALGLARVGSYSGNGSGDLFIAFSTANEAVNLVGPASVRMLGNDQLDPLFLATVQAVEESIVNALIAATAMTGVKGARAPAIDHGALQTVLKQYGRFNAPITTDRRAPSP
jgi:D-aminopeptidase